MKIGIDVSSLSSQLTGVGEYTRLLLICLRRYGLQHEYQLFHSSFKNRLPSYLMRSTPQFKIHSYRIPGKLLLRWWKKYRWPTVETFLGDLDVFHSPNFLYHPTAKAKTVCTIHDLAFLRDPYYGQEFGGAYFRDSLERWIETASLIFVPSQATADDVAFFFPNQQDHVSVVYHGLDPDYETEIKPENIEKVQRNYSLPAHYAVAVGTLEPRKNYAMMLKSWKLIEERLPADWGLVIIGGKGWDFGETFMLHRQLKQQTRVKLLGYVPTPQLQYILKGADIYTSSSDFEGFGLPLLEAMNLGLPCLTTRGGALPEIGGDAVCYVDVGDVPGYAEALLDLIEDTKQREKMGQLSEQRIAEFTIERMAHKVLEGYEGLS